MTHPIYLRPHVDRWLGKVHKLTIWNRHPRVITCAYTCLITRSQAEKIQAHVAELRK